MIHRNKTTCNKLWASVGYPFFTFAASSANFTSFKLWETSVYTRRLFHFQEWKNNSLYLILNFLEPCFKLKIFFLIVISHLSTKHRSSHLGYLCAKRIDHMQILSSPFFSRFSERLLVKRAPYFGLESDTVPKWKKKREREKASSPSHRRRLILWLNWNSLTGSGGRFYSKRKWK